MSKSYVIAEPVEGRWEYRFVADIGPVIRWSTSTDDALIFADRVSADVAFDGIRGRLTPGGEVRPLAWHPKPDLRTYWRDGEWPQSTHVLLDTMARGDSAATVEVLQARAVAGVGPFTVVPEGEKPLFDVFGLADDGFVDAHRRARQGRFKAHLERVAAIGRGEIEDDSALVASLREQLAELDRADESWQTRRGDFEDAVVRAGRKAKEAE